MARYAFGPPLDTPRPLAPAPAVAEGARADVPVAYNGITPRGDYTFLVPAYDATKYHQLVAIHVGLYRDKDRLPTDPAQVVDAPHHASESVAGLTVGGLVIVECHDAPAGASTALAVLEFAD